MASDYDIGAAFDRIEDILIASMTRSLKRHKVREVTEGFRWAQWQTLQLQALDSYRRSNLSKFSAEFKSINNKLSKTIATSYSDGATKQERSILQAINNGYKSVAKTAYSGTAETAGEFFTTNSRKLDALVQATTNDMEKAEAAVLRKANDNYRKIIFNAQVYANTGAGTYEQAIDMATKDFLSAGIQSVEYKNGRKVDITTYSEMALRTASKRAYLQGEGEKRKEWGIHTVILNKRSNPCPKCAPFVGKVFIDDVYSGGSKDGISSVTGIKYPLLSEAIAQGLYHPNCRDSHTTYFEGVSTPPTGSEYTKEELDELADKYYLEQKAKQAEKQAKRLERMSKYSLDGENKRVYGHRAKQWKSKARQLKNEINKSTVKEESKPKISNKATVVDKNIIESSAYRRQIDKLGENTNTSREMYQQTKNILAHRSGTEYEDLVFIDTETGKSLSRTDYDVVRECMPSAKMKTMVNKALQGSVIAIHNHPYSSVPSIADIDAANVRGYKFGVVACHNGDIYKYTILGEYNPVIVDFALDKLNTAIYNKDENKISAILKELKAQNIKMEVLTWS